MSEIKCKHLDPFFLENYSEGVFLDNGAFRIVNDDKIEVSFLNKNNKCKNIKTYIDDLAKDEELCNHLGITIETISFQGVPIKMRKKDRVNVGMGAFLPVTYFYKKNSLRRLKKEFRKYLIKKEKERVALYRQIGMGTCVISKSLFNSLNFLNKRMIKEKWLTKKQT